LLLDRKSLFLIVLACALFAGCAQIGSISGGNKDDIAPRIINSSIKQNERNLKAQVFTFEFDERITLNPAKESVVLVPSDATAETSVSGKTLTITWDKPWKENTTYSLFMNGVVKDFHEGNDSLYTYIFSSGPDLDSSTIKVNVNEAFKNSPAQKITVGLFESMSEQSPRYFARTDKFGMANINAIKAGNYVLKAFEDANNNLTIDSLEKQGFDTTFRAILKGSIDSANLYLSTPRGADKIKNKKFIPPGLLALHVPVGKQNPILFNGKLLPEDRIFKEKDSMILAVAPIQEDKFFLVIGNDTINQLVNKTGKTTPIRLALNATSDENSDQVIFDANDFISTIDQGKSRVISMPDSAIVPVQISFSKQRIQLKSLSSWSGNFFFECDSNALVGYSGNTNSRKLRMAFSIKSERELGVLHLKVSKEGSYVMFLVKDGKSSRQLAFNGSSITVPRLSPGKYDIQLILDTNQNGEWDPVDPRRNIQPERVLYFPEATSIRANWEVEKTIELD